MLGSDFWGLRVAFSLQNARAAQIAERTQKSGLLSEVQVTAPAGVPASDVDFRVP